MMAYKFSRRELSELQKDIDYLVSSLLPHVRGDLNKAQELLFVPLPKLDVTPVELVRRGQTEQARYALLEIFKTIKAKRDFEERKRLERKQRSLIDF